jgi:hypothetical protein
MKILHLTLRQRWFNRVYCETKPEEYRELKPYWIKRLDGRNYDCVCFRNGYGLDKPEVVLELKAIRIGRGKYMLGAPADRDCFILELGKIISERNIPAELDTFKKWLIKQKATPCSSVSSVVKNKQVKNENRD